MRRYIVNSKMPGFTPAEITDEVLKDKDALVLVVLSSDSGAVLSDYYNSIRDMLAAQARVILVGVGDEPSDIFFPLTTMMAGYKAYDVYQIKSLSILNSTYVEKLIERKPSFEEVQSFIGGKVTAYSELSTLIIGIESMVNEDKIDGLKVFLSRHMPSIENMITTIEYFKKQADLANSRELLAKVETLGKTIEGLNEQLNDSRAKCTELRDSKVALNTEVDKLQKEVTKLKEKNDELEDSAGSMMIKTYSEVRTSSIACKPKIVLYFKEISYIPYMNSFILAIFEMLKIHRPNRQSLRVKLLIYDTNTEIFSSYNKINKINSQEYFNNKDNHLKISEKLVILDPNPVILTDVLEVTPQYDVVIVYDRMKKLTDVVSGNNVYKFFVINSLNEYNSLKAPMKILDPSFVITRPDVEIDKAIKLAKINGYKDVPVSGTSRVSKYNKKFQEIAEKIRLSAVFG